MLSVKNKLVTTEKIHKDGSSGSVKAGVYETSSLQMHFTNIDHHIKHQLLTNLFVFQNMTKCLHKKHYTQV